MSTDNSKRGPSTTSEKGLKRWCERAGIGYSTFFTLPQDARPVGAKIGKRFVPTEDPEAWLQRMAARGGVRTTRNCA